MTSYDDIIIGSGLSALGVALGLPAERRVLVIGGPETGRISYYDGGRGVPNAYLGHGGLGRFWHGVIPTGLEPRPAGLETADFVELFNRFYPKAAVEDRIEQPWLFVPGRPIRTPKAWARLQQTRRRHLTIRHDFALSFGGMADSVSVRTRDGAYLASRLWIAAGVLHTPRLLSASLSGFDGVRSQLADHVIAYMGLVDRGAHPEIHAPLVERRPGGFWIRATFNPNRQGLFTLKPARFSYRQLDKGIEQRAAFGLPTGGVIAKLLRTSSPALLSEAIFNKLGLFPDARRMSVYAQILVPDAYDFDADAPTIRPRRDSIVVAVDAVRRDPAWRDVLVSSARPDLFINGIHLHHSVDGAALNRRGVNLDDSLIQVVDASVADDIGAEHHSFKLMAAAFAKAKRA